MNFNIPDNNFNQKFCYLFLGYKKSIPIYTWDNWLLLAHFIIGILIGLIFDY